MRNFLYFSAVCVFFLQACTSTTTSLTPSMSVEDIVNQTLVAYTIEAVLKQATAPAQAKATQTPPATQTIVMTPQENAPSPLPGSHTGVVLNNGECFNFDNGLVTTPDDQCDIWLAEPALLRQKNGAQISGYVTLSTPTRSHCASARYEAPAGDEAGDLAVQTDMFMCFITNQANIGFVVVRQYRGDAPITGIVFDYWVFKE